MNITKTTNGYLIATIHNNIRVKQIYYGYTKREAKKLFANHLKTLKDE